MNPTKNDSCTLVSYTLSVTNKDVSPCTTSAFTLSSSVPAGWTGTLTSVSLSLAPGATASTTLKVTSSSTAANGTYSVGATARNSIAAAASASASASYIVSNPVGGGGGAFADNFNRGDSALLGSPWTVVAGNFVVASDMLKTKLGTTGTSLSVVSALSGPTQSVEADFTSVDNNLGPKFGLVLRYQDPNNYYLIHRATGGSSLLLISRVVNGVQTDLARVSIGNPAKGVAFHLTARATGTALSLDFGGVNKINFNDATFATGKVGIVILNKSGNVQQAADNFKATVQ